MAGDAEVWPPATGLTDGLLKTHVVNTEFKGQFQSPDVGVIMGSASDLPAIEPALDILENFEVPYENRIVSAHRTPEWMAEYGHSAIRRGLRVIIAMAGGSAHLPGDMASYTSLPVIGVAREDVPDPLNAALGSMLEMPPEGGPLVVSGKVTKESKAGAINAGLFAVRVLALSDPSLMSKVEERMRSKARAVLKDDEALQEMGRQAFMQSKNLKSRG